MESLVDGFFMLFTVILIAELTAIEGTLVSSSPLKTERREKETELPLMAT